MKQTRCPECQGDGFIVDIYSDPTGECPKCNGTGKVPLELKKLLSYGNNKLPSTTAIFNMSPASECPAAKLGFCKISDICYAKKPETYGYAPKCLPYRLRQSEYWLSATADEFTKDFYEAISRKKKVTAVRFNEAGDFHSQECVDKAVKIAFILKHLGITTYCYTKRDDLDFSARGDLRVIGSNKMYDAEYISVKGAAKAFEESKEKKHLCPADCKKCNVCLWGEKIKIFAEIH